MQAWCSKGCISRGRCRVPWISVIVTPGKRYSVKSSSPTPFGPCQRIVPGVGLVAVAGRGVRCDSNSVSSKRKAVGMQKDRQEQGQSEDVSARAVQDALRKK